MQPTEADLLHAGAFLAHRGHFGVVWMDETGRAVQRFGPLAEFVPPGVPISDSVPALVGLDDDIRMLRDGSGASIQLPNVRLDPSLKDGPRFDIALYWLGDRHQYLLLLGRADTPSELEVALSAQMRARVIAEKEVEAKARIIERQNGELARANADLNEFAYVLSHDLRSPLRALRYGAEDAEASLARADTDQAAADLVRVRQQARRMADMIDGLLQYARVGRKSEAAEEVDTRALVRRIVDSLPRPATLEVRLESDWPVLTTLAQPLDIVLRNLLDNAIRHHHTGSGLIEVRADARDASHVLFSVADDGPGIAPEWRKAIFEPFRTVAGSEKPSLGMGLAIVARTLQLLGGRIEVISRPERACGTEFRVHWLKSVTE